jgi:signal transduction histidine kinase
VFGISNFACSAAIELYLPLYEDSFNEAVFGQPNVSDLYRVDDRHFKSAFYPLNSDSLTTILVVESAFGFFDEFRTFRETMLIINLVAILFLVLIGSAVVVLNRKLVKAEKLLVSQAALSQMGQMAAIIAHEVRNPLAIIKATAERIRRRYAEGADDPTLEFIPEEVERLNQITTRYLQFASPADLSQDRESLAVIVQSVLEGLKREISSKGISLEEKIDPDSELMLANSAKLRQVLINLLRNAIEAMGKGGELSISVSAFERPNMAAISIADTGSGLSKKELARIFDPFYTTKSKGSGLGLFIVGRLVKELGGKLTVDSQLGKGTTFTIHLEVTVDG